MRDAFRPPNLLTLVERHGLACNRREPFALDAHDDRVLLRLWIVARPGPPLGPLTAQVRSTVSATVERLLGLELAAVTILVDGVGG